MNEDRGANASSIGVEAALLKDAPLDGGRGVEDEHPTAGCIRDSRDRQGAASQNREPVDDRIARLAIRESEAASDVAAVQDGLLSAGEGGKHEILTTEVEVAVERTFIDARRDEDRVSGRGRGERFLDRGTLRGDVPGDGCCRRGKSCGEQGAAYGRRCMRITMTDRQSNGAELFPNSVSYVRTKNYGLVSLVVAICSVC